MVAGGRGANIREDCTRRRSRRSCAIYKPAFFAPDDFAALETFTEILIPTDDTPGAREALCAHYIDFVLQAAGPELQSQWRGAMSALKEAGFHSADARGADRLVSAMARPRRIARRTHPLYSVFRLIKQQTTFAFYTSRAGIIETLDYRGNTFNAVVPGVHASRAPGGVRDACHAFRADVHMTPDTTRSSSAPARAAAGRRWS